MLQVELLFIERTPEGGGTKICSNDPVHKMIMTRTWRARAVHAQNA